jgi:hypothetical protein
LASEHLVQLARVELALLGCRALFFMFGRRPDEARIRSERERLLRRAVVAA